MSLRLRYAGYAQKKIDDDFDLKLIHTARGMGYMMDAPE